MGPRHERFRATLRRRRLGQLMDARTWMASKRRRASILLSGALCLHNLEEAVSYPIARPRVSNLAAGVWPQLQLPMADAFRWALLILTIAVLALLLWAATTRNEGAAWLVIKVVAFVLLANVLVPHVPAAILLGGYAPGVVTAVALNLPVGVWVLALARSVRPRPEHPALR